MHIDKQILELAQKAEEELQDMYKKADRIAEIHSARILSAFQKNRVSYTDFAEINGYGNYDAGRDKLEAIFAQVLGCEDALVRPQITSGTNALYLTFSAYLKHGDTMLSLTGTPYDSLQEMIGLSGDSPLSLKENGILFEQIDLKNGCFDTEAILKRLERKDVKLAEIQRSRGYSSRRSLPLCEIRELIRKIREVNRDVIILIDNCYGELVEETVAGETGADVLVGSLMKNLGGGIAPTGGYIAGRGDLVQIAAERLNAPGIGKEQGANFNLNASFFKGLFLAPQAVANAVKTAVFAAYMLEKLGYENISPRFQEARTDIIQTVKLGSEEKLVAFCQGIQEASPIDSFVKVVSAPMPGYPFNEVMACGAFVQGSTIELSADAPVIPPYTLYIQGGLTYQYGKLGIMSALTKMKGEA